MSDNPYANSFSGSYGEPQPAPARPAQSQPPQPHMPGSPAAGGGAGVVLQGFGNDAGAPPAGDLIKDTTTRDFPADVIQESRNQPVLVDFWAPWCGPCKQLTPLIERVVQAANGKVKLVKMNIDEHPSIAGQLGVQSIPAVFAFVDGQPVDGFMGALPESELQKFIERVLQQAGPAKSGGDPIAEAMTQASELLAAGDTGNAAQIFGAILQHEPEHVAATGGLAECYMQSGDTGRASTLIETLPPEADSDPLVAGVKAKLKLNEEIAGLGDPAELQSRLDQNADDHQARFDLALIAQARGERAQAADLLLEVMRRDREFADDGARRKLLELFEAWGPTDPATRDARRKLSSLLFR